MHPQHDHRIRLWLLVILECCIAGTGMCTKISASDANHPSASKPNFLVILADDLGYSDLGCYGSEIKTPNLDRLAENGLRFTQFYNTARCWPTRGAMLTGYYAQEIRRDAFPSNPKQGQRARPAWAKLVTEYLRQEGYRNYHSGKWHIDGKPLKNGFDHSFEIGGGQNNYFKTNGITIDEKPIPPRDDFYVTESAADHAIACLKEHSEQFSNQPFFQYLAFTAPHFPLHAKQEDIDRYRDLYRVGWNQIRQSRFEKQRSMNMVQPTMSLPELELGPPYHFADAFEKLGPGEINRPLPWASLNETQQSFQASKMAIHAAMIDRIDREVGRVIEQLRSMKALENTLIFFLSDNGASAEIMVRGDGHDPEAPMGSAKTYLCLGPGWSNSSNTPFRRHKTWVHEGGISTPLIAHWPAGIQAKGELRNAPGHVIDITATMLELAGTSRPAQFNNQPTPPSPAESLVPIFAKDGSRTRQELWWSHEANRALRAGDWKIVASGAEAPWELYDLSQDRAEQNNLAKSHPEKLKELTEKWESRTAEYERISKLD